VTVDSDIRQTLEAIGRLRQDLAYADEQVHITSRYADLAALAVVLTQLATEAQLEQALKVIAGASPSRHHAEAILIETLGDRFPHQRAPMMGRLEVVPDA
jgi:hypothetical protein